MKKLFISFLIAFTMNRTLVSADLNDTANAVEMVQMKTVDTLIKELKKTCKPARPVDGNVTVDKWSTSGIWEDIYSCRRSLLPEECIHEIENGCDEIKFFIRDWVFEIKTKPIQTITCNAPWSRGCWTFDDMNPEVVTITNQNELKELVGLLSQSANRARFVTQTK